MVFAKLTNLSKQFPSIGAVLAAASLLSCETNREALPLGVLDDGTPHVAGSGLSSGLDEPAPNLPAEATRPIQHKSPQETYIVKARFLNIRSGPGTSYKVQRVVRAGEVLEGVMAGDAWFKLAENEFVSLKHLVPKNDIGKP